MKYRLTFRSTFRYAMLPALAAAVLFSNVVLA
jgi:hypothetical protein